MKRAISLLGMALACGFIAAVAAQTPQTEKKMTTEVKDSKTVTVTGCLQAGTEPNTFVLTNVAETPSSIGDMTKPETTPPSPPTAGTTGTKGKSFKLIADAGISLKEHVGHKVEVTGTIASHGKATSGASSTTTSTTGASIPATRGDMTTGTLPRQLHIKTLRHISETCS